MKRSNSTPAQHQNAIELDDGILVGWRTDNS